MRKSFLYTITTLLFIFTSCSSSLSSTEVTQLTTITLDLSASYYKSGEVEDALRVLNETAEFSNDIRLIENRVLIFIAEKRYKEGYTEAMRLYNTYPYYIKALRYALECADGLEDKDKQRELYTLLFERNAVTIDDLQHLLEITIEENRNDEAMGIINYGIEKGIYNKKFFETAYEFTKDEEFNMALTYIK